MDHPSPKTSPRSPVHFVVTWRVAAGTDTANPNRVTADCSRAQQDRATFSSASTARVCFDRMNGIDRIRVHPVHPVILSNFDPSGTATIVGGNAIAKECFSSQHRRRQSCRRPRIYFARATFAISGRVAGEKVDRYRAALRASNSSCATLRPRNVRRQRERRFDCPFANATCRPPLHVMVRWCFVSDQEQPWPRTAIQVYRVHRREANHPRISHKGTKTRSLELNRFVP